MLQDIPKHVLITSAAVTKRGTIRTKHFALVCNSSVPLKMGGRAFRFSNAHYKNLSKDGKVGKSATGKRTTAALVRWTGSPISGAECDSLIDFSADLCTPYCVELFDPVRISSSAVAKLNQQIASGLGIRAVEARCGDHQAINLRAIVSASNFLLMRASSLKGSCTKKTFSFCFLNEAMLMMRQTHVQMPRQRTRIVWSLVSLE